MHTTFKFKCHLQYGHVITETSSSKSVDTLGFYPDVIRIKISPLAHEDQIS